MEPNFTVVHLIEVVLVDVELFLELCSDSLEIFNFFGDIDVSFLLLVLDLLLRLELLITFLPIYILFKLLIVYIQRPHGLLLTPRGSLLVHFLELLVILPELVFDLTLFLAQLVIRESFHVPIHQLG